MNTISTFSYRHKYRLAKLDVLLRKNLISKDIFMEDKSGLKYIESPYGSQPTTTVQTIAGTYSISSFTLTDDTLTVTDEFICPEHVHDWNKVLTQFDVLNSRIDEQNYSVAAAMDKYILNEILANANGAYTTPAGGFSTATNVNVIIANLFSYVIGYAQMYKGLFCVVENTDVPGIIQSGAASGFSFADAALNNGWVGNLMGVDFYVIRAGGFSDESTSTASGTKTWTNDGHRLFGVKKVCTYAQPDGIKYEEKAITLKTGVEIVTYGYIGAKVWASIQDLIVDITLA